MKRINTYRNEKLFEVIRQYFDGNKLVRYPTYRDQEVLQIHTSCGHAFTCRWKLRNCMGGVADDGSCYICPKCGKALAKNTYDTPWYDYPDAEDNYARVPYKIILQIKEYKNFLDVVIHTINAEITGPIDVELHKYKKYSIRFDFKAGKTYFATFEKRKKSTKELWPFRLTESQIENDATKIDIRRTPLNYLNLASSIHFEERKSLDTFYLDIVHLFEKKLSESVGYKVKSAYTATNMQTGGALNDGFSNMAWRMMYPDARNLKTDDYKHCIDDKDSLMQIMNDGGRKTFLRAVKDAYRLPDKKGLDKRLAGCSFSVFPIIKKAWPVFHEISNKYELIDKLTAYYKKEYCDRMVLTRIMQSLRLIKHLRGEPCALNLLRTESKFELVDIYLIYKGLQKDLIYKFIHIRPRGRDIHNTLYKLKYLQNHKNIRIKYRPKADFLLTGKVDDLVFSLPPDTDQLIHLGNAMHNCVGTYRDRLINGEIRIVAAFKNRKPVMCIELRNRQIVQAKLADNRIVATDNELNATLLKWAKAKKLKISTADVRKETEVRWENGFMSIA